MLHMPESITSMLVKHYAIYPAINYVIVPYVGIFAIKGPLRKKLYGEGPGRRMFFSKDALKKLGITPSKLWSFIQLPLMSPVEVSEFNRASIRLFPS